MTLGGNSRLQEKLRINKLILQAREIKKNNANCKLCCDKGWKFQTNEFGEIILNEWGDIQEMPCDCRFQQKLDTELKKMGLADRVKENTLYNYEPKNENQKKILEKVKQYSVNYIGSWLLLSGQTGAGKTHLAIAAWNEARIDNSKNHSVKGTRARVVEFNDLLSELQASKNFEAEENTKQVLDKYKNVSILLLDDLFRNNESKEAKEWIFQILNYRVNANLPTIITTNLSFQDLQKTEETITGRIFQKTNGWTYWLEFGKDNRLNHRLQI